MPDRRARVACRNCHLRKVRCNVVQSGQPCSNCQADDVVCEVLPRKKRARKTEPPLVSSDRQYHVLHGQDRFDNPIFQQPDPATNIVPLAHPSPEIARDLPAANLHPTPSDQQYVQPSSKNGSAPDEGENPDALAVALDTNASPTNQGTLIYSGAQHGAVGFLNSLVSPGRDKEELHYLIPHGITRAKQPEDLTFLRSKGAFSIPSQAVCDELIKAFFHHVYPMLPIVDAVAFLDLYQRRGCQNINLLLLWSIFLAAANFVDARILDEAGYKTRKGMKRAFYQRAKALYDNAQDDDQVSLLQSIILLGFWYADAQDRFEAWHWIGIAISLGQTLGLHRHTNSRSTAQSLSVAKARLFRRIWWSCFVRDRWLSLVKGRPMRINLEDCDVPLPTTEDISDELGTLSEAVKDSYLPFPSKVVGNLWCRLVQVSVALGDLLRVHYSIRGVSAGVDDIEASQQELDKCANQQMDSSSPLDHPFVQVLDAQVLLFVEAATAVLYRPYILKGPPGLTHEVQKTWQKMCLERAKGAASRTNSVLETLMNADLVKYMKPMTMTVMVPAMQIHLLDCKSPITSVRRLGHHKLDLCMMVLSELRETYWGADFTYRMFDRARTKLMDSTNTAPLTSNQSVPLTSQTFSDVNPPITPNLDNFIPSMDNLLSPNFALGEFFGPGYTDQNDLESIGTDFGLNSFIDPSEFDNFLGNAGLYPG